MALFLWGVSPLRALVTGTASRRQLRRSNAGWSDTWYLSGGVSRKFSPLGTTSLQISYGESDKAGVTVDRNFYGVGFAQNVDAAAMDIYGSWRRYDTGAVTNGETDIFILGTRIRF